MQSAMKSRFLPERSAAASYERALEPSLWKSRAVDSGELQLHSNVPVSKPPSKSTPSLAARLAAEKSAKWEPAPASSNARSDAVLLSMFGGQANGSSPPLPRSPSSATGSRVAAPAAHLPRQPLRTGVAPRAPPPHLDPECAALDEEIAGLEAEIAELRRDEIVELQDELAAQMVELREVEGQLRRSRPLGCAPSRGVISRATPCH